MMFRSLCFLLALLPTLAFAQTHSHGATTQPMSPADHMKMGHGSPAFTTKQTGQDAFAAIQEIVQILEADPQTDWTKVDIDALRQHLIDMSNVTLLAVVSSERLSDGMRFTVTGSDPVVASIRRMITAHAATMSGVGGWRFEAADADRGAVLDVHVPPADMAKLKALGFMGVMTRGMHHQEHHLMIARGQHPH